jgi:putative FmdB family regulatory protein
MPFYEYECQACKFYCEVMQKISDAPLAKCPSCGKRTLKKLVSAPVFRLKGGGWYETDFKSDKESKRNLLGAEKEEPAAAGKSEPAADKTQAPQSKEAQTPADKAAATPAKPAAAGGTAPRARRRVSVSSKARPAARGAGRRAAKPRGGGRRR